MISKRIISYIIFYLLLFSGCSKGDLNTPDPNVVASFKGGIITREHLKTKFDELMPCCKERYKGLEGQKLLLKNMVLPIAISDIIKKKNIDLRQNIREELGNIAGELNMTFLHMKFHEKVLESDEKYRELRETYRLQKRRLEGYPISERFQRLLQLHQKIHPNIAKEVEEIGKNYLQKLRNEASITRNFELLMIKSTEDELKNFYQQHKDEYRVPDRVKIEEIRVEFKKGRNDCPNCPEEEKAKEIIQKALDELKSGAEFKEVAGKYSSNVQSIEPKWLEKGVNGQEFDDIAFSIEPGEISPIFKSGNSFYIIRVLEKKKGYLKSYEEVRDQIEKEYKWQKGEEFLRENSDRILFSINGKPYTIGDFIKEYEKEIDPHICHHMKYSEMKHGENKKPMLCDFAHNTIEEQKKIINRMIDKELIVEDTFNQMIHVEHQREVELLTMSYLYPIFHEEEMRKMIRITDKMIEDYYRKHQEKYQSPARAKIRMIMIKGGEKKEEKEKAYQKAKEVYKNIKPSIFSFKKGMDFGEAARKYSDDKETASKGGLLDFDVYECRNEVEYMLLHGFHKKIFELKPGDISEIFDFGDDYYIVEIMEMERRKKIPFQEIKEEVKKDLMKEEHQKVMERWEDDLLRSIGYVVYEKPLKEVLEELINKKKEEKNGKFTNS